MSTTEREQLEARLKELDAQDPVRVAKAAATSLGAVVTDVPAEEGGSTSGLDVYLDIGPAKIRTRGEPNVVATLLASVVNEFRRRGIIV